MGSGDTEACGGQGFTLEEYGESYTRYWKPVRAYIAKRVDSPQVAEQLAQEVFTDLWEKWQSIPRSSNLPALLFTMAQRRAGMRARRRALVSPIPVDAFVPDGCNSDYEYVIDQPTMFSPDHAGRAIDRVDMDNALTQLPKRQREALDLHYRKGFKCREIAAQWGVSEGVVWFHLCRGREALRRLMGD